MSQSLNGHKIRNVANKVKHLDSINDQIVLEILRQFCPTTLQELRNDSSVLYEEALQAQYIHMAVTHLVPNTYGPRTFGPPQLVHN